MKRFTFICAMLLIGVLLQAQDNQLSITVVQPEYDNIPEEARASLENKLEQILINNGVTSGLSDRFVMSAKINVIQRDIMPSNPPKISQKLDVTITIGDVVDNKVYGKTIISVSGIGLTDTKALIQAFQRISPQNDKVKILVEQASKQIADYYINHCDAILAEAERMANMNQLEGAIAKLIAVPEMCGDCYAQARTKATDLYAAKIECEAQQLITQATAEWSIKHNYEQARKACDLLVQINPNTKAARKARVLFNEIENTLRAQEAAIAAHEQEKEKREWEMYVQQYNDNIELRKQRMDMWKEIGVAIGNHLPQTITKVVRMW